MPYDRKSTRLNSSHGSISYAVFCLKKKKKTRPHSIAALPTPSFTSLLTTRPAQRLGARGRHGRSGAPAAPGAVQKTSGRKTRPRERKKARAKAGGEATA